MYDDLIDPFTIMPTNKTAIITGGTKGIGAAIARKFYEDGYAVALGAREDNGLAKKLGSRARFHAMDVRRESDHEDIVKDLLGWKKRLDVYINCAGFSRWSSIAKVDEAFLTEMTDTNFKGTFWGCKVASKNLSKGGSIINISSIAGKRGSANNTVYCSTKFAVTGLTQALAKELGPRGIRVNGVCPVYIETEGLMAVLKDRDAPPQGKDVRSYLKNFTAQNAALGRLPSAQEVAQVCLFLSSDAASAITGQNIQVDCGVLPQ